MPAAVIFSFLVKYISGAPVTFTRNTSADGQVNDSRLMFVIVFSPFCCVRDG